MKIIKLFTTIILLFAGILITQINAQQTDLVLEDMSITTTITFEAINSITARSAFSIESTGNVTFRSGNFITLDPTFTVKLGGIFYAFSGVPVGIEEDEAEIPNWLILKQNYPNPFSNHTEICYGLPNRDHVTIVIFGLAGQKIKTLISQKQLAGYHSLIWNATDESGKKVNAGIYTCLIQTSKSTSSRKLLVFN